jgi:hypothetical protein
VFRTLQPRDRSTRAQPCIQRARVLSTTHEY